MRKDRMVSKRRIVSPLWQSCITRLTLPRKFQDNSINLGRSGRAQIFRTISRFFEIRTCYTLRTGVPLDFSKATKATLAFPIDLAQFHDQSAHLTFSLFWNAWRRLRFHPPTTQKKTQVLTGSLICSYTWVGLTLIFEYKVGPPLLKCSTCESQKTWRSS